MAKKKINPVTYTPGQGNQQSNESVTYTPGQGNQQSNEPATYTPGQGNQQSGNPVTYTPGQGSQQSNEPVTYTPSQGNQQSNEPVTYTPGQSNQQSDNPVTYTPGQGNQQSNEPVTYTPGQGSQQSNEPATYTPGQGSQQSNEPVTYTPNQGSQQSNPITYTPEQNNQPNNEPMTYIPAQGNQQSNEEENYSAGQSNYQFSNLTNNIIEQNSQITPPTNGSSPMIEEVQPLFSNPTISSVPISSTEANSPNNQILVSQEQVDEFKEKIIDTVAVYPILIQKLKEGIANQLYLNSNIPVNEIQYFIKEVVDSHPAFKGIESVLQRVGNVIMEESTIGKPFEPIALAVESGLETELGNFVFNAESINNLLILANPTEEQKSQWQQEMQQRWENFKINMSSSESIVRTFSKAFETNQFIYQTFTNADNLIVITIGSIFQGTWNMIAKGNDLLYILHADKLPEYLAKATLSMIENSKLTSSVTSNVNLQRPLIQALVPPPLQPVAPLAKSLFDFVNNLK